MDDEQVSRRARDIQLDTCAAAAVRAISACHGDRDRAIARFLLRLADRLQDDRRPAPGPARSSRAA
jgi:hypothetical protein